MRLDALQIEPITAAGTSRGTVLFADLRGYTAMAERLSPPYLASLLDDFFNILTQAAEKHGGKVYHTAGDSLMAGFGLKADDGAGAAPAVAASRTMLESFTALAEHWRSEAQIEAGLGIGLHLGPVAIAEFGPPSRRIETLVGDTANVAARLCSRARAGEVLFSCTVAAALEAQALREDRAFLHLPRYEMRGRREPLDIWCIPASGVRTPLHALHIVVEPRSAGR